MDEYAKMCNCEEVQGQWKKDGSGQRVAVDYNPGGFVDIHIYLPRQGLYDYADARIWKIDDDGLLWLPRQEEIQEMCGQDAYAFLYACSKQASEMVCAGEYSDKTMVDEIAIRWFMMRIHNKTWTEKGWV